MQQSFVVDEARLVARTVKQIGSRFILLYTFTSTLKKFLPILDEEGMLGPDWQYFASDSSVSIGLLELLPAGCFLISFVNKGPLYPKFQELLSKLDLDDWIGPNSTERYKLEANLIDAVHLNASMQHITTDPYASFAFDATYTFLVAANNLMHQGLNESEIYGEVLLEELRRTQFFGVSGEVSFDENGDRAASYEILNVVSGAEDPKTVAIFSVSTKQFTFLDNLTWMDGSVGNFLPRHLVSCDPGFYKEEKFSPCKPCPKGTRCAGGEDSFRNCPRGSFSNATGSVNCTLCPEGSFAADVGSVACSLCTSGFVANDTGLESCSPCSRGNYMPFSGGTNCLECGLNRITEAPGATSESQCRCDEGLFFCAPELGTVGARGCKACPSGLHCPGGLGTPMQEAGRWTYPMQGTACDFAVLSCRNDNQCPQGALGVCAEGREGKACNNCKEGYFPLENGTCQKCQEADLLPAIAIFILIPMAIILLSCFNMDPNQQSLNLLTAAAVTSQIIMSVQALGSIRQLSIEWPVPVKSLIDLTRLLTFNLDIIKVGCVYGNDSPILKFTSQILICPVGCCLICLGWLIQQIDRRSKMSWDGVINLCGLLFFALFLSITLSTMIPFQCQQNPNGSRSMVSEPGIICFDSEEHSILVILASFGILSQPVAILCWTTYTTVMYPLRVSTGRGLRLVHRYRFLFHRFKPECYYYGSVLLYRNAMIAILPVALSRLPELQIPVMGSLLLISVIVQARTSPWRTKFANVVELLLTAFLMVTLLGASPLLELDIKVSSNILGWLLCIPILSLILTGLVAMLRPVWLHFQGIQRFDIFLCHHKAGAGSLCRLLKLLMARHSSTVRVFLDCDQLENLDFLFDVVRTSTRNVVVVLTPELLKRVWCAGEIATAHKNGIDTMPLVCDGFRPLTVEALRTISTLWSSQQIQMLANYGISIEDVTKAYTWLQGPHLKPMKMPRFGHASTREKVAVDILSRCAPRRVSGFGFSNAPQILLTGLNTSFTDTAGQSKGRILITSSVADAESLSTCEVFQLMLQAHLQVECVVVQGSRQMVSWKPWAYYLVVLLFRGMFRDAGFARMLTAAFDLSGRRALEVVTVIADAQFDFPSVDVYDKEDSDNLALFGDEQSTVSAQAYRRLLNVVALPFSPFASDGLQKNQVAEIATRFHRYKDPALAVAWDRSDDQLLFEEEHLEHPDGVLASISPNVFSVHSIGELGPFSPTGRSPYAMIESILSENETFGGFKFDSGGSQDSFGI